jgi:hypothetical protein
MLLAGTLLKKQKAHSAVPLILFFSFSNLAWRLSTRNLEHNMATVSTQLEDIQEKMYDFEQNKECSLTDIA